MSKKFPEYLRLLLPILLLAMIFPAFLAAEESKASFSKSDIQGWINLGKSYYYGDLLTGQDYAKALPYFEQAAGHDHPEALYMLGTMYYNGHSVPKDQKKAEELYGKAAALGQPDAQMIVANQHMYLAMRYPPDSDKRKNEYVKAASLLESAAKQKQPEAMLWYGDMQIKGLGGLPKDAGKGLALVRKSANLHNANAHAMLASYYMEGAPVAKDFSKAYTHMYISRELGNKNATFGLKMLERSLSAQEIKAAVNEADEWLEKHPHTAAKTEPRQP